MTAANVQSADTSSVDADTEKDAFLAISPSLRKVA